uniref:SAC3/GANP/THP3 conserved domain-containing protein n=1 Tax=Compsopogon caeruleus TaxID=31354 RepID=A0A7S1XBR2_9RHOD|mmetsp:Transcript_12153/g.24786  ORF Transcript_12153/g.24786 Transcript_12153/m.24786 type:complete len:852 (+) Transcript_12153:411-2966(+)|eukprot:CAMPEP_0184686470 /NCGR_PEP_ID=MMETSP0312-20130426/22613_1 /TAXON_ID=31354 /ORGANISM="Compsopogon coeruleus, Strain SAG 36.94" /LENGTH=851 /DNA_ID=CAMNT_0027141593 /DNA_START=324 /DNA_END=2879 /DNA_ORIENTATION=+
MDTFIDSETGKPYISDGKRSTWLWDILADEKGNRYAFNNKTKESVWLVMHPELEKIANSKIREDQWPLIHRVEQTQARTTVATETNKGATASSLPASSSLAPTSKPTVGSGQEPGDHRLHPNAQARSVDLASSNLTNAARLQNCDRMIKEQFPGRSAPRHPITGLTSGGAVRPGWRRVRIGNFDCIKSEFSQALEWLNPLDLAWVRDWLQQIIVGELHSNEGVNERCGSILRSLLREETTFVGYLDRIEREFGPPPNSVVSGTAKTGFVWAKRARAMSKLDPGHGLGPEKEELDWADRRGSSKIVPAEAGSSPRHSAPPPQNRGDRSGWHARDRSPPRVTGRPSEDYEMNRDSQLGRGNISQKSGRDRESNRGFSYREETRLRDSSPTPRRMPDSPRDDLRSQQSRQYSRAISEGEAEKPRPVPRKPHNRRWSAVETSEMGERRSRNPTQSPDNGDQSHDEAHPKRRRANGLAEYNLDRVHRNPRFSAPGDGSRSERDQPHVSEDPQYGRRRPITTEERDHLAKLADEAKSSWSAKGESSYPPCSEGMWRIFAVCRARNRESHYSSERYAPIIEADEEEDSEKEPPALVGTNLSLEKRYLRLTSAAKPEDVRPPSVLMQALKVLQEKWKNEEIDYPYLLDQLKAIRQDLKVQGIEDAFTLNVYENQSRLALEAKDVGEFNASLTQVVELHDKVVANPLHVEEFCSYRILYALYNGNKIEITGLLQGLPDKLLRSDVVLKTLKACEAVRANNFVSFFRYYASAPCMQMYLMDWFVGRERSRALMRITKAFKVKPWIEVADAFHLLGGHAAEETLEQFQEFLISIGTVIEDKLIVCPNSTIREADIVRPRAMA